MSDDYDMSDCGAHYDTEEMLAIDEGAKNYIKTNCLDGNWRASIVIMREYYHAEGQTETAAINALKYHLINIIPIYENDIMVAQEKIKAIKEIVK